MSKSMARFQNELDLDYEEHQLNKNLNQNHSSILEKRIRKCKLNINSKNNLYTQNTSSFYQSETKAKLLSKFTQFDRKHMNTTKNVKTHNFHQLPNVPLQDKFTSNTDKFTKCFQMKGHSSKQIMLPLSPIKETEEYVLYQNKLKSVLINNQQQLYKDLELIVFKIEEQHKIKIEPGLIEGLILNDKILKNHNLIFLECYSCQQIYQIQIEFEDMYDYEQFQLF